MRLSNRIFNRSGIWRGKALLRLSLLVGAAAAVAAVASRFGVSRDYSYLRASLLTGAPGGHYHALGTRLAPPVQSVNRHRETLEFVRASISDR